ncbi:hypothetical protein Y032_0020g187 [Ancylostoma ceylanicum]|uniref:CMP/dCMP-type deaminase domain-containing protein n=1 Tax=Ancylostoma ceylanicum TaxID=53326 RepID=A0A016V1B3_9BILA|nr:hypothetical protein Y032_0020g187 [Ancylostoma ceylanicum]
MGSYWSGLRKNLTIISRRNFGEAFIVANCENASYGGTICAERNAITTALSKGYRKFKAIAVVTELQEPASPCGMCRQFLVEFGNCRVKNFLCAILAFV